MNKPKTIKELVLQEVEKNNSFPEEKYLEQQVKKYFPNSKWKKTHYSWYKSKVKNNFFKVKDEISLDNIEIKEAEAFSLSLERDLLAFLSTKLDEIEIGLELVDNGIEYKTEAGFIDLLAKDKENNFVVIELKAGKAKDSVIGQILGYINAIKSKKKTENVRGIIVASDFEKRTLHAAEELQNVVLIKYILSFNFEEKKLIK